jgi:hypothetical protein
MTGEPQNCVLKFVSKFALDILPAALASVIGGFLFTQWHSAPPPPVTPAAVEEVAVEQIQEAMRMVRDEHSLIVDYLKSQHMAAEEAEIARAKAFEEARRKAASREAVEPKLAAKRRLAETAKAPRPAAERQDIVAAGEPLVLAPVVISPPPRGPIASAAATASEFKEKVFSTFGGMRDFIGNVGDKLLGRETNANPGRWHHS